MKRALLLFSLLQLSCQIANAQDEKIHAMFIYKFIENIGWPPAKSELVVGILGSRRVKDELEKVIKSRNRTNINVKQIGLADVTECDVVYLSQKENSLCKSVVEITRGRSILIVTEDAELIKRGAGISFVKENDRIGFAINKLALDTRNIKISTTLMQISKEI